MRILHYLGSCRLSDGGVVRVVIDMVAALAAVGHEVTIVTRDAHDLPGDWDGSNGLPRVCVLEQTAIGLPLAEQRAHFLSRRAKVQVQNLFREVDVAHFHVIWDYVCWQLASIARQLRLPYIVCVHGMLDDWSMSQRRPKKRATLALVARRFLERAAAVQCTAEAERDQAIVWFPRGKPCIVPCIMDLSNFVNLPGPEQARQAFPHAFVGMPTTLYMGRIHPKKGPDELIRAIDYLRRQGVSCRALFGGEARDQQYQHQLQDLTNQLDIADQIVFLGFVSGPTKISLYQAADLLCLPTHQENWGLVLTESLACETPVVTTYGVDIWKEIRASGGGLIVDRDARAIGDAMMSILGDDAERQSMGQAGRRWVLQQLAVDHVTSMYERMYRAALEQKQTKGSV